MTELEPGVVNKQAQNGIKHRDTRLVGERPLLVTICSDLLLYPLHSSAVLCLPCLLFQPAAAPAAAALVHHRHRSLRKLCRGRHTPGRPCSGSLTPVPVEPTHLFLAPLHPTLSPYKAIVCRPLPAQALKSPRVMPPTFIEGFPCGWHFSG